MSSSIWYRDAWYPFYLTYPVSPEHSYSVRTDSPTHVVCNVPLVVPKPRSFKRLTLDFDLPSVDQDLSHPPYTTPVSSKRKRQPSDNGDDPPNGVKRKILAEPSSHNQHSHRFRNKPPKPR